MESKEQPGSIYTQYVHPTKGIVEKDVRSSFELHHDSAITYKALEFKYAARRQGRVLVIDMLKPWQARICKLIGIKVGE